MDADIDGGAVGLLSLDPLDVDPELATVALNHLANLNNIQIIKLFILNAIFNFQR